MKEKKEITIKHRPIKYVKAAYANYSVVKRKNGAQTVLSKNAAKKKPFLT